MEDRLFRCIAVVKKNARIGVAVRAMAAQGRPNRC
jgi:hypothetical protein